MKEKLDFRPLTVRLNSEEGEALERLAASEDREIAWIHRRLLREALAARGLIPPDAGQKQSSTQRGAPPSHQVKAAVGKRPRFVSPAVAGNLPRLRPLSRNPVRSMRFGWGRGRGRYAATPGGLGRAPERLGSEIG